ncbi:MAG: gluconeogenesis factor YvcK family protein [Acidimicrobiales bacterium]
MSGAGEVASTDNRPTVVALGGGHGLATTLAAVDSYASHVTAVVSVADDGGSSGRLREAWQGPAPGDIRRCLISMAQRSKGPAAAKTWARALDYRFADGELAGHSLGNLVLVGLSETMGDFVQATQQLARLLEVHATVLPATSVPVTLQAEVLALGASRASLAPVGLPAKAPARGAGQAPSKTFGAGANLGAESKVVTGQSKIAHAEGPVRKVWLVPPDPPALPEAVRTIASADQVVIGPGSLFTSVLATCLVPGIKEAISRRRGGRVYVCNLRPQDSETLGFDADAHLEALASHGIEVDVVVCDPATEVGAPKLAARAKPALVSAAMALPNGHAHDAERLGKVLAALVGATPA